MKSTVNRQIATTHLTSKVWQTIVAILGVIFGVSMYIFMNSFMNGVNSTQDELAFSTLAHIRIYNEDNRSTYNPVQDQYSDASTVYNIRNRKSIQYTEGIRNSTEVMELIRQQPEVSGLAPELGFSAFFRNGSRKVNGMVTGVDVKAEDELFQLSEKIVEGSWLDLETNPSGIILGINLAQNLGVKVGDPVNLLSSDGTTRNYTVVALLETSMKEVDKTRAYMNISSARQLLGKNFDFASDIQVNIQNRERTEQVIGRISGLIPYQVESWQSANQQLVAATQLRNIVAVAVSITILIVAGFGIYNIMNMTINEKIKEIAILKAMGFAGKDIRNIFLQQAVIIGFVGGIAGIVLGYGISSLVNQVPFRIAGLSTLPIVYQAGDFIMAVLFGITTTIIAGYLPARKAAKIDPVIIIRG